jgi:pimeloyl-ACP methyl ester carboxylesterase
VDPRDGVVQANGLHFHYLEWGSAADPHLLLLHGFGNEAHIWDRFAPLVNDRYHVIALDSRGHGDSDRAQEYGDEFNAADTIAICDALGLRRLTLVGFSMGGGNAILVTSRQPERVERLVIVDRGPVSNAAGRERMNHAVSQAKSVFSNAEEALAYIRLANPRRPEELVEASLHHAFRSLPDGSYELKYDPKLREGRAGHRGSAVDWWRLLEGIGCPTLIVRGGESDILAQDVAEKMLTVLPDAKLEVVPGAGHPVMMDNPEGFNRVVNGWLP